MGFIYFKLSFIMALYHFSIFFFFFFAFKILNSEDQPLLISLPAIFQFYFYFPYTPGIFFSPSSLTSWSFIHAFIHSSNTWPHLYRSLQVFIFKRQMLPLVTFLGLAVLETCYLTPLAKGKISLIEAKLKLDSSSCSQQAVDLYLNRFWISVFLQDNSVGVLLLDSGHECVWRENYFFLTLTVAPLTTKAVYPEDAGTNSWNRWRWWLAYFAPFPSFLVWKAHLSILPL